MCLMAEDHFLYDNQEVVDYLLENNAEHIWSKEFKCERYSLYVARKDSFSDVDWRNLNESIISTYDEKRDDKHGYKLYERLRETEEQDIDVFYPQICDVYRANKGERKEYDRYFNRYVESHWVGDHSDYSVDDFVKLTPEELYLVLTTVTKENFRGATINMDDVKNINFVRKLLEERRSQYFSHAKNIPDTAINLAEYMFKINNVEEKLWGEIFNSLSSIRSSWEKMQAILYRLDQSLIQKNLHPITNWFKRVTEDLETHREMYFWKIIDRFMNMEELDDSCPYESDSDFILKAINSPIGIITEAVINCLYVRIQENNCDEKMLSKIRGLLEHLITRQKQNCYPVLVILSRSLYYLYVIDPKWAKNQIIAKMSQNVEDLPAKAMWIGYLYNPKVHLDLLKLLKKPFMDLFGKRKEFKIKGEDLPSMIINFCIRSVLFFPELFQEKELQQPMFCFTIQELKVVAQALLNHLVIQKDYEFCWQNRILPWFDRNWPKKSLDNYGEISYYFAKMIIMLGPQSEHAFTVFQGCLQYLEPQYLVYDTLLDIKQNNFCCDQPKTCVNLLESIIDVNLLQDYQLNELQEILNRVVESNSNLKKHDFVRRVSVRSI